MSYLSNRLPTKKNSGAPIKLCLTIDRDAKRAKFDFTGSGNQVISNINTPRAVVYSAVIYSLRAMVHEEIPLNSGCLDPVENLNFVQV